MEEKDYRNLVSQVFSRVSDAFDSVDPDLAECENVQGALTITFSNQTKLILSTQPSVRQIWVAAASKGIAAHFSYDLNQGKWLDDKKPSIELIDFIEKNVSEQINQMIKIR
ncbi:MAG: iron donor protein CyaY [Bacteriovoracia bacterium]